MVFSVLLKGKALKWWAEYSSSRNPWTDVSQEDASPWPPPQNAEICILNSMCHNGVRAIPSLENFLGAAPMCKTLYATLQLRRGSMSMTSSRFKLTFGFPKPARLVYTIQLIDGVSFQSIALMFHSSFGTINRKRLIIRIDLESCVFWSFGLQLP